eukprot:2243111-Rhodomonas_salina.1
MSLTLVASGYREVQPMMLEVVHDREAWDANGKAWDPTVCHVLGHETLAEGQAGVMTCNCTRDRLFVQLLDYHCDSSDIINLTSVGARPEV